MKTRIIGLKSNLFFVNRLNKFLMKFVKYHLPEFESYKLIKSLRIQSSPEGTSIGIYKNSEGKRFFIKSFQYKVKNFRYLQLKNEIQATNEFKKIAKILRIKSPKLIKVIEERNRISIILEYINGKTLETYSSDKQSNTVNEVIRSLVNIKYNSRKNIRLDKISRRFTILSFLFYFCYLVLKDLSNFFSYIKAFFYFFKYIHKSISLPEELVLTHRDLSFDNLIIDNKDLYILDPELAVFAEKYTDWAIFLKNVYKDSNIDNTTSFLPRILNDEELDKVKYLSIYYTIQTLSVIPKRTEEFRKARKFLTWLLNKNNKNYNNVNLSLAEFFHKVVLIFISKFDFLQKIFLFVNFRPTIIICYHSISDSNWRFSTKINNFEQQIEYLSKNFEIISLDEIHKNNVSNKKAIITFDDGYEDFMSNALPILKKYNVPSTMFVLGDGKNANRSELQNKKKLLTLDQIKEIRTQGVEIGYHTGTHSDLRALSNEELKYEIIQSKENLEKKLGFNINYFAYPRGIYSDNIIKFVKLAGFKAAFTVDGGEISLSKSHFLFNRISIEGATTFGEFKAMLSPVGLKFEKFYMYILKTKESVSQAIKLLMTSKDSIEKIAMSKYE